MTALAPPEELFLYNAKVDPRCEAVVVHCSDPRLQVAFREFIACELALEVGDFMPLVISGGASVLAHPERLPKEFKFIRDRLGFYRAVMPSLKRVILIAHQGCRYSQALRARVVGAPRLAGGEEHGELHQARAAVGPTLLRLDLAAELYFARFAGPDRAQVGFERVW